eukprot:m.107238 g.107238  ORF g.107238 m.107238 type:complete len:412 (+) comp15841_c0_seq1:1625-2860(+)
MAAVTGAVRVLLVGGSGYVGQHLLRRLQGDVGYPVVVAYTYNTEPLPAAPVTTTATATTAAAAPPPLPPSFALHLGETATADAVGDVFRDVQRALGGDLDVIVHLAANSSPAGCSKLSQPALDAVNTPTALVDAWQAVCPAALFVFFSSEQVYSGEASATPWNEDSPTTPPNAYARSKLAMETLLRERTTTATTTTAMAATQTSSQLTECETCCISPQRAVALRMANCVGPPAPWTGSGKFAQWLLGKLQQDDAPFDCFEDERRSFVVVSDVCDVVVELIAQDVQQQRQQQRPQQQQRQQLQDQQCLDCSACNTSNGDGGNDGSDESRFRTFCVGGPRALTRVELALMVAKQRNLPLQTSSSGQEKVRPVQRASLHWGYTSPLDLTLDSTRAQSCLLKRPWTQVSDVIGQF